MAQRSIENYFNVKKRVANAELLSSKSKRVKQLHTNEEFSAPLEKSVKNVEESSEPVRRILRPRRTSTVDKIETPVVTTVNDNIQEANVSQPTKTAKEVNKVAKHSVGDFQVSSLNVLKKKVVRGDRLDKLKETIARLDNKEINRQACRQSTTSIKTKLDIPSASSVSIPINNEDALIPVCSSKSVNDKIQEAKTSQPIQTAKEVNEVAKQSVSDSEVASLDILKKKFVGSDRLGELKKIIASLDDKETKRSACRQSTTLNKIKLDIPSASSVSIPVNKEDVLIPACSKSVQLPTNTESLTLPYSFKYLIKLFRAAETVCQILYNRSEIIIFRKLKSGVEKMIRRSFAENHLAQIKSLYPEAYHFIYEKLREFGTGTRREKWELVIKPNIEGSQMTSSILLQRSQRLQDLLLKRVIMCHTKFLKKLYPGSTCDSTNIVRWHPDFNVESVPDIEESALPQCPTEEKLMTGSEVLEKARQIFNCNTRVERALEKLKEAEEKGIVPEPVKVEVENPLFKGISKDILERVRKRQAAKALDVITRSSEKEKEAQLYSQLPDVARLLKNLFISEKKAVLPFDLVIDKLCNSYRVFTSKSSMETYLKTLSKEVPEWIVLHNIRESIFVKLSRNADVTMVLNKLANLAESKKA